MIDGVKTRQRRRACCRPITLLGLQDRPLAVQDRTNLLQAEYFTRA